jgi:hypothetical protein
MRSRKGPVLAEETSEPVLRCSDWTALSAQFVPPAGASAFRVGVTAVGRGGRILVDDISVRAGPGSGPEKEHRIGTFVVRPTRQGLLQIGLRGQHALLNVGCRLETEKDGALGQSVAQAVSVTAQENLLVFTGKLASPADGREIEFEQQVAFEDGGATVVYRFQGEALAQVERLGIAATLPKGAAPPDADTLAQPRSRVTIRCDEGEVALEYLDPARLAPRHSEGRLILVQTWPVEMREGEAVVGIRVRDASGGSGPADPVQAAAAARKAGRLGEALSILRGYLGRVKEQAIRDRVEAEVKALEESERRDWTDLQATVFQATLVRRPEALARASQALELYGRQWSGEPYDTKAEPLRAELAAVPAGAQEEGARALQLLERARVLEKSGKPLQAEALARTVVARYPSTEAARGAKELLQALSP